MNDSENKDTEYNAEEGKSNLGDTVHENDLRTASDSKEPAKPEYKTAGDKESPELPIDKIQSYVRSISENGSPEPPKKPFSANRGNQISYRGQSFNVSSGEADIFKTARRLLYGSIVLGIVSLFIGGVILSAIALVLGVMAYLRMRDVSEFKSIDDPFIAKAFKQSGIAGIVISVIALVLNFYSMAVLWPQLMEYINTADYSTSFNGSGLFGNSSGSTGGSSTWG